jgi:hypothetical protein
VARPACSKLFPSISKEVWFQCQVFPKNLLAVLWDFNDLQWMQTQLHTFQTFWARATGKGKAFPVAPKRHVFEFRF